MDFVVRLDGAVQAALERLIAHGFFKTRSEAVRAGIMHLAKEYGVRPTASEVVEDKGGSHRHLAMHEYAKKMGGRK